MKPHVAPHRTLVAAVAVGALLAVALAGCAPPPGGTPGGPTGRVPAPAPAPGEVHGQGVVLQTGDGAAQLCLGAVAESYPPQCGGPKVAGWDWSAVDGAEQAAGVTWGSYAVTGTWDGTEFEPTRPPVPLALFDPGPVDPDPLLEPDNAGATSEARLLQIQQELAGLGVDVLASLPQNGYLFVDVVYDDGSLQEYLDAGYGAGVVVVRSALTPATPENED